MDLITYIEDMGRRRALADAVNSNPDYLWQIATGRRQPSPALAKAIEATTREMGPEAVSKASLLPDVWGEEQPVAEAAGARSAGQGG